jgi:hypothetical protein
MVTIHSYTHSARIDNALFIGSPTFLSPMCGPGCSRKMVTKHPDVLPPSNPVDVLTEEIHGRTLFYSPPQQEIREMKLEYTINSSWEIDSVVYQFIHINEYLLGKLQRNRIHGD